MQYIIDHLGREIRCNDIKQADADGTQVSFMDDEGIFYVISKNKILTKDDE